MHELTPYGPNMSGFAEMKVTVFVVEAVCNGLDVFVAVTVCLNTLLNKIASFILSFQ